MKTERNSYRRWLICGFVLFLLIYFFMTEAGRVLSVSMPLFIGIALAYVINIMTGWFMRHDVLYNRKIIRSEKLHQNLSIAMALLAILLVLILIVVFLVPQVTESFSKFLVKIPKGLEALFQLPVLTDILPEDTLTSLQNEDWSKWTERAVVLLNSDDLIRGMTTTASSAISWFGTIAFALMFTIYFTTGRAERTGNLRRIIKAFIPVEKQGHFFERAGLLNHCFRSFIICQSLQALIIGVLTAVIMLIFRFPYAVMIGVLNGICALIPVVGGYVGAALGTLIILPDSTQMALAFLIMIILVQNGVGTLIFPRLVGDSLGLPGVWTLAAVVIGSGMMGIKGILLAVPLVAFGYRCLMDEVKRREDLRSAAEKQEESTDTP